VGLRKFESQKEAIKQRRDWGAVREKKRPRNISIEGRSREYCTNTKTEEGKVSGGETGRLSEVSYVPL